MDGKLFLEFLRKRRSIRSFKENAIDESKTDEMLEAINLAPSSGGLQTFEIYQVKNKEMKEKLVSAAKDQTFVAQAPLLLIFCANPSRSVERFGERSQLFSVQDATIAAAYAQLTSHALGLSTVWIGAFDEKQVSEILDIPKGQRPIAILPIGYENEKPKEKATRGAKDLLHVIN
ncbi:nitroreductase family protein [Candidatus Nitrosotalea okcheonensis]|uniref:Putative NADH dehydrogenase/NAD(P)H nitroreductase AF_0226 n=1 Tax=Candidatus Nitrosotalea okcheonensis TaxID=1903276 RepID=A0A2H1FEI1_9ARCH|nr:nitroreductase family protein [Candidatus Nitrosotalea okcheonensis]SMH71192.1 putative NADH dehydrogenase/NAD(P)H nitroreductase AF_0226 [Candidatus Nitrosotalea okcheonensis]